FEGTHPEPDDIRQIPRPRIVYCGALSRWVDYELLAGLARQRQDWNFVVIGANHRVDAAQKLGGLRNVTLLRERSASEVPAYLAAMDVGLALYDTRFSSWLDGDSMKLLEYLAAGLPCVSTAFHEDLAGDFDHLVEVVQDDVKAFEQTVARLLVGDP